jgi:hypothetical protein
MSMRTPIAESGPTVQEAAAPFFAEPRTKAKSFQAFGLTISSCIDFPELIPATGEAQVSVLYGDVPQELPGATCKGVCYEAIPGQVLFQLPGVARFWVRDGKEIVVDRHPDAHDDDVRLVLLSSPFGALLQERGYLVLSGSMVKAEDGCVIFAGPSGVGKSSLAAAMRRQGYLCMSDDICAISIGEDGVPYAVGSYPQAKLWPDALEHLSIDIASVRHVRPCLEKRAVPFEDAYCHERLPVKRLYWICASRHKPDICIEPITGPRKLKVLRDSTYRLEFLSGLGLTTPHFKQLASLAAHVAAVDLTRPAAGCPLDRLVNAIKGDLHS